ncbi:HlyD family efflux transporter periplasmic adaptor subunit [Xanthobacter sp.]|uniref:efflux RND transporter periplasmic adaptor subunit n=1 Tax=Xanthobacter sp. TaxID=35809 RepID=UPI0025D1B3EF|nr:HlyD family efflux transporter periplasmic adaptor subunit [Xanthobacter sp.]
MGRHFLRNVMFGLCGLLACAALSGSAEAHEGHDHGAPQPPQVTTLAPRAEAASADFELVAVLRDGLLTIYLDRFADNAPVEGAAVEVDTPEGSQPAKPAGPGTYVLPAPFAATPGAHDIAFTVTAGHAVEVLAATLTVPAAAATASDMQMAAPAVLAQLGVLPVGVLAGFLVGFLAGALVMSRRRVGALLILGSLGVALAGAPQGAWAADTQPPARDAAQRLPDGSVIVPKPTQRILGVRTLVAGAGTFAGTVELPGRVVPDANASGLVQTAVGGRLAPPEGGFKPLGTKVAAGEILAYVHPPIGASDLKDLEQQGYELDQQIALVKRRYERLSAIPNAVTRREVEEAEIELKGLQTRRARLERVQREPEALRAPVSGVIAAADAVAGQMADPNTVVFRIVDPGRLWVEALGFSPDAGRSGATGRLPNGRTVDLTFLGAGLPERAQALPLLFSVASDTGELRPGQFLTVFAEAGAPRIGIAIPRSAVVRGANGQSIVYAHVSAERFVSLEVKTQPLDATRVLVVAGLSPGQRVVTDGAELIDQIR